MDSTHDGYITDVAYIDNYYEQLSPLAINYLAALNGHLPRNPDDFDYCELGCGNGLSLVVHAATHPGGRFTGIDINPEHIARARGRANAAGLTNLALYADAIADWVARDDGQQFDFIAMHGLYTWVSDAVRADIHRFIERRLKPGGLVLVSYNAKPGFSAREPLRNIMRRFATPLSTNPLERAHLGLSYLRLMLNAQVPFFRLNPELAKYAESLFDKDPHYIAHEFFHDDWHIFGVDEVAGAMQNSGLAFAGTLPLWQNHADIDVPANVSGLFNVQTERVTREVHKDFLYNTVFRTDLYVAAPADAAPLPRAETLAAMCFRAAVPATDVQFAPLAGANQLSLNTPLHRTVFALLQDQARTFADLAAQPALAGHGRDDLVAALTQWVLSGQVRPTLPAPLPPSHPVIAATNRALLAEAFAAGDRDGALLLSPCYGSAFWFDKTQALALAVLADPAAGEAGATLAELMKHCGLSMEEDGRALDEEALANLAMDLSDDLEASGALAQARLLGVVG